MYPFRENLIKRNFHLFKKKHAPKGRKNTSRPVVFKTSLGRSRPQGRGSGSILKLVALLSISPYRFSGLPSPIYITSRFFKGRCVMMMVRPCCTAMRLRVQIANFLFSLSSRKHSRIFCRYLKIIHTMTSNNN